MTIYQPIVKMRRAIAMIELIFSIVIIGITLLTVPILVSQSTQSTYTALQQESIAADAVEINTIMSTEWDVNDTNHADGAPILRTTIVTNIPNCAGQYPPGVTNTQGRTCWDAALAPLNASPIGTEVEGVFFNDVDDYDGQNYSLNVYNGDAISTAKGDYIDQNITIASTIRYGNDQPRIAGGGASAGGYDRNTTFSNPFTNAPLAGTSNIKLINVTLTSNSISNELNDKNITLSAFMCNIGAPSGFITNW